MKYLNTQRVTVSLPSYLYEDLKTMLGKGELSKFVAEATEAKLLESRLKPSDPIKAFFALREKAPKRTDAQIMASIRRGRT